MAHKSIYFICDAVQIDEGDKSEDSDLSLEQLRAKLDAKANASGW